MLLPMVIGSWAISEVMEVASDVNEIVTDNLFNTQYGVWQGEKRSISMTDSYMNVVLNEDRNVLMAQGTVDNNNRDIFELLDSIYNRGRV